MRQLVFVVGLVALVAGVAPERAARADPPPGPPVDPATTIATDGAHDDATVTRRLRATLTSPAPDEPSMLFSAGVFALVAAFDYPYSVGAQYSARPLSKWRVAPGLGGAFGPDGIAFVYVDVRRDFALAHRWYFTPSLATGYFTNGDVIGPRDHLELQTGIMFSRELGAGARVGLAGLHVSNGGLSHPNNGTEAILLTVRLALAP